MQPDPLADSDRGRVLAALRRVDPNVRSISDYINGETPPEVLPDLAATLDGVREPGVSESVVRALAVRGAGPEVARSLLRAFTRDEQPEHVRWAAGNALLEVRDPETALDIVQLVIEPKYGAARQMLALALGYFRKRQAQPKP